MKRADELLFAFWCVVMPINNFVFFPSIPGSIPAYVCAGVSLVFIGARMMSGRIDSQLLSYLKLLVCAGTMWTLLLAGSQLGHLLSGRAGFGDAPLIGSSDPTVVLRAQLFTQSMYLFACILVALYFRFYFQAHMMRYVYWGASFMAAYGIYEWLFFLIFKSPGDFLGNRVYGMGTADTHTGSWSQDIDFAGLDLLRIKSTFGEPSFFCAAVIPYFFLALDTRKRLLTALLFFCAFFSTSTSCYLTLAACFFVRSVWVGKRIGANLAALALFSAGLYLMSMLVPDTFDALFGNKLAGDNDSGHTHQIAIDALKDLLSTFTPLNWIFGVGVGYIYAEATLSVFFNTGLIGLTLFLFMFGKPIFRLDNGDSESLGLKSALLGILIAYTINVAELYLPSTWMFLGLAYWKLAGQYVPAPHVTSTTVSTAGGLIPNFSHAQNRTTPP